MMSETRARASRLARWLGSLERNGFTGRRAPPSPTAVDAPGGVIGGRGVGAAGGIDALAAGGVGGDAGRGVGAGVGAEVVALGPVNGLGAADGIDVAAGEDDVGGAGGLLEDPGTNGGADGAAPPGRAGVNPGVAGGELNSGIPPVGDGGVAVAMIGPDSDRWRGIAGDSPVLVGFGGGAGVYGGAGGAVNGADPCADGVAARAVAAGVVTPLGAGMLMTPLQTEHRARTPLGGTFAGSTRKIERQSGQLTFIHSLRSCEPRVSPAAAPAA